MGLPRVGHLVKLIVMNRVPGVLLDTMQFNLLALVRVFVDKMYALVQMELLQLEIVQREVVRVQLMIDQNVYPVLQEDF